MALQALLAGVPIDPQQHAAPTPYLHFSMFRRDGNVADRLRCADVSDIEVVRTKNTAGIRREHPKRLG